MTESCPFEPQLEEKERRRHFNKFLTKKGKFLINEDNATSFKLSDSEIIFDKTLSTGLDHTVLQTS